MLFAPLVQLSVHSICTHDIKHKIDKRQALMEHVAAAHQTDPRAVIYFVNVRGPFGFVI